MIVIVIKKKRKVMNKDINEVIQKWERTCLLNGTRDNDRVELAMILEYCDLGKLEYNLDAYLTERLRKVYDFIELVNIVEKDVVLA